MHVDWIYEKDENVINGTSISKSHITKLIAKIFLCARSIANSGWKRGERQKRVKERERQERGSER